MKRPRHTLFAAALLPLILAPAAAEAGTAYQKVWYPDGHISWFNKDVTNAGTSSANIRAAMTFLASRTPVSVTELSSSTGANLTFSKYGVLGSGSGMTYGYWFQNRADSEKVIEFSPNGTITEGTVLHEVMHALGFAHEFQRPERADFVDMCANADQFNYGKIGNVWIPGAHWNLSPYDFASITNGSYDCATPLPGVEQQSSQYQGETDNLLSAHDINSLYRIYQGAIGTNADGDAFGHAVAAGDFDDDEIEDIAVAAAEPSSGSVALRIYFYRGVMTDPSEEPGVGTSYVPWFRHTFNSAAVAGSRLTLAAGDFNGDGISDLAVGDPSYSNNKGRVRILFVNTGPDDDVKNDSRAPWGRRGIQASKDILPADVGLSSVVTGRFGKSLAAGVLTSPFGLSITFDTPYDDLIIGAPTASALMVPGPTGGAIVHVRGREEPTGANWTPGGSLVKWNPGTSSGDEFGAAVSVIPGMCIDEDSSQDHDVFIVGSPGYSSSAGAVRVYGCATDEAEAMLSAPLLRTLTHAQTGARYGASVAGFRKRQSKFYVQHRYYAAIGAPKYVGSGSNPDSGIVYLDEFTPDGTKTSIDSFRPLARSGGDEFGYSLAVQQDGISENEPREGGYEVYIAIGMPGTKVDGTPAGKVYIWKPWNHDQSLSGTADIIEPLNPTAQTDTRFGEAVTVLRNRDTNGGFVVGAPKSAELDIAIVDGDVIWSMLNAGSVDVLLNDYPGLYEWGTSRRHILQETAGDHQPEN